MPDIQTEQRPDLFSDWYNRFVKKPMLERPPSLTTPSAAIAPSAPATPATPAFDEAGFQNWYKGHAATTGINPNPDDPAHKYDYRAAYTAGATPNAEGHWPSQFKAPDHPNRFVNGIDTITGQPAPDATPEPPASTPGVLSRFSEGLKNPAAVALLGTGLSLAATPPRPVPYTNTELLGRAGLQGLNIYESALENARKAKLAEQAQEDRRLAIQDRGEYYRATAETRAMNAKTLADQRESKMRELEAAAQSKEESNKPIGPNPFGLPEDMTVGVAAKMAPYYKPQTEKTPRLAQITIGGETKAYDLNNLPDDVQDALYNGEAKLPPGMTVSTDAQGGVHVIPKVPGVTPGAGKPSAAKGGKPTNFDTELKKAETSLKEKGVEKPTTEQIAAERTRLFPKGLAKTAGRSPRDELKGGTGAAKKVKMPDGTIKEFDAQGNEIKK